MAAVLTLGLMAACAPAVRGSVTAAAPVGTQAVGLDGRSFAAALAPGAAGVSLTRAGVVPVPGRTITVTQAGAPLGQADGAVAKRVAKLGCEQAGGRFNPAALGRYAGQGAWAFPGGCA